MSDSPAQSAPRVSPLLSVLRQRRPRTGAEAEGAAEPAPAASDAVVETGAGEASAADVPAPWFRGQASASPRRAPILRDVTALSGADAATVATPAFGSGSSQLAARRSQRRRQRWGVLASFLAVVGVPTVAASAYYLFVASDQYVSEAKFALRSIERNTGRDAANVTGGPPGALSGNTDSFIIADYITTRQFIDEVQGKIDLRGIFSNPAADFWTRFDPKAPVEALVNHWRAMVLSRYDMSTGILTVKVRAYTPEDSLRLAQAVISGSEHVANELTNRGRQDFIRFAETEVRKAEERLQSARNALGSFRRTQGTFDPVRVATSNADLLAKLRSDLAGMRADAATLSVAMQPNAPALQTLTNRIRATEQQVRAVENDGQRGGAGEGGDMGSMVARYASLDAEQTFAEKSYGMAMDALRSARSVADRQQVYLATFSQPALAESAQFPNRPTSIALVAGFAMLFWLTGLLIVLGVRDHMR